MRSLRTSWKHIRRNPYQSLTAIFIIMITFFVISIFAFIILATSIVVDFLESRLDTVAFIKEDIKQSDINNLQTELKQTGLVANMKFISKKDALNKYRELNKDDPILLELVTEDILPASLEISTHNISDLPKISAKLKNSPIVDIVKFQEDVATNLTNWTNAIKIVGVTLIGVLTVESILIIITIISFKISQKKEEIEIMKLLSATNWYIRRPFLLEGIFYGVIGTFMGWGLAVLTLIYSVPYLQPFFKGIPLPPLSSDLIFKLLAGEILIAAAIGMFAGSVAVLRYLK